VLSVQVFEPLPHRRCCQTGVCQSTFSQTAYLCDFALATLDDFVAVWQNAAALDVAKQWKAYGAGEVVDKGWCKPSFVDG
jgi:hypothetical protein